MMIPVMIDANTTPITTINIQMVLFLSLSLTQLSFSPTLSCLGVIVGLAISSSIISSWWESVERRRNYRCNLFSFLIHFHLQSAPSSTISSVYSIAELGNSPVSNRNYQYKPLPRNGHYNLLQITPAVLHHRNNLHYLNTR